MYLLLLMFRLFHSKYQLDKANIHSSAKNELKYGKYPILGDVNKRLWSESIVLQRNIIGIVLGFHRA